VRGFYYYFTNNMRIRTKIILSFFVMALVPVLIVGIYLTSHLRELALSNALDQTAANVERVNKRTSDMLNVPNDISYRLYNDSRLARIVTREYESVYSVVQTYKEYPDFREYQRLYKEISSIRLYVDNPTMLNNWEFLQPTPDVTGTFWYKRAMASNGLIAWNYIEDNRNGQPYLSLIRRLDFVGTDMKGVLVINVDTAMLNAILSQETFETMIVDEYNRIVAANREGRAGKTLAALHFDTDAIARGEGTYDATIDGRKSRIMIDEWHPDASVNGLRIISVFSVDSIMQKPNEVIGLALTVIAVGLVVAYLLIHGFSSLLTRRLLRLSKHISTVATGKLDMPLRSDGADEIGQLARQFNAMVASINHLMREVRETNEQKNKLELKQNEIRFRMMASQINPHFLFNTLESIRMKAVLRNEKEIARVVRLLGKMMRKNLEAGNTRIPLRAEIDIVQCYLDIQKFRYEDRLSYELAVDPRAERTPIPSLIIQPLVENAVIHGLENKEAGVNVRVEVEWREEGVHVAVSDDGAGMTPERLLEVEASLMRPDEEDAGRIGLRNVHMRIQLLYGSGCGLSIDSQPGEGTTVQFIIPHEGGQAVHV